MADVGGSIMQNLSLVLGHASIRTENYYAQRQIALELKMTSALIAMRSG